MMQCREAGGTFWADAVVDGCPHTVFLDALERLMQLARQVRRRKHQVQRHLQHSTAYIYGRGIENKSTIGQVQACCAEACRPAVCTISSQDSKMPSAKQGSLRRTCMRA